MNKEQRERMAYRTIVQQQDEGQQDIEYTVQVAGQHVEIHQDSEDEYDEETGYSGYERVTWEMSLDTLKKLIEAAQWCIEKSEAFEKAHPAQPTCDQLPIEEVEKLEWVVEGWQLLAAQAMQHEEPGDEL